MGIPISNYNVLKQLAGQKGEREREATQRALQQFDLFAFVVHDPATHPEFDLKLNSLFDRLDYVTGNKLLFFALLDAPQEWLQHARGRDYYRALGSPQVGQLTGLRNPIISTDRSTTAFSMATSLRIPSDMLPCIVVTRDFYKGSFRWFKTSPQHIEEQLKELGFIAARGLNLFEEFSENLASVHLCRESGSENLQSSLAKALTRVLSFVVANSDANSWERRQAFAQAQSSILELQSQVTRLKENLNSKQAGENTEQQQELEELCISIGSFLALLAPQDEINFDQFVFIEKSLLEPDSYRLLQTARKVFHLLASESKGVVFELGLKQDPDFTPSVICLTKLFEKEINLSVVHWMRAELGITLPEYFDKVQPRTSAIYTPRIPNGRQIDFNVKRQGRWLAPGIGQSEIACKDYAIDKPIEGWDASSWGLLLDNWKIVREKRNQAAHTESVDEETLLAVKHSLNSLSSSRIFERIFRMKKQYNGK